MSNLSEYYEEDGDSPTSSINFSHLCTNFLIYYADYCKAVDKASFLRNPNEMNWVLFGVSGAGKSTTVARLLDDMSPSEFWKKLQEGNESQKHTVMKGVRIGHEVNSCTVVPTPFTLRPRLHITDMPGFAESNAEKKISIDILQKCFMTAIDQFTLLIVVEVGVIFQQRFQMLRDDYHKALWNLLGSEYQHGIPHFYFLLTKKKQMEGHSKSLEWVLNRGIRQLMTRGSDKDTALFAQFLARLCDHHVVVDLETCDNESLLDEIQEMIKAGEEEAKGLHIPTFNVSQLAAGENKLNELCFSYLVDTALPKQTNLSTQVMVLEDAWKAESTKILAETKAIRGEKRAAVENRMEWERKLEKVTKAVEAYPKIREGFKGDLDSSRRRHVVCKEKLGIFKKHSKDGDFINVRIDVPIKSNKKFGRGPLFVSEINADISSDGSTWDHIIVMDYEANNDTLRSSLSGSLVPDKISDIENMDGTSVLFNSKTGVTRGDLEVERPPLQNNEGWRWIKLKRATRFKVFIYTARRFSSMPFFNKLEQGFQREVKKEAEETSRITHLIEELDKKHEQDEDDKVEYTRQLEEARENVKNVEEDVDALIENHPASIQQLRAEVSELEDQVEAWQKHELVTQVGKIIGILQKNKIETMAAPLYEEFSNKFRAIFQKLHGLKSAMTTFEQSNAESLEGTKNGQFKGI